METRQILETLGLERAALAASLVGAICSLRFVDKARSRRDKLVIVIAGWAFAAYGAPFAVHAFGLNDSAIGGLSFFAGLFGMSLADAIQQAIKDGAVLNLIRGRIGQ